MDDMEDDARYPPKTYTLNYCNPSNNRRKVHRRENPYSRLITKRYEDDDEMDEFDEETEAEEDQDHQNGYFNNIEKDDDDDFDRHPKKRKLKNLISRYEFAPRVKPSFGDRSLGDEKDWTDHAVFVLLEVWGDRFLQLGRKSLRSEDWHEVAEKVSEELKIERTVTQCRNMLDTLKRKYKKEKKKMEETGLNYSKWAYFKKMHMLMASPPRQDCGLACGVDSGEYVFMNTRVYLDRSNGYDEMRDSPGESESSEGENENVNGNDLDGILSRRMRSGGNGFQGSSVRVLADSIQKFGEVYEKIESSKRQQMMELEKMRLDFHKELEIQKKQILERAQAEIAKIHEEDDEETDPSATEDLSE
ncbi:trihelix transcription factor ENAP1 [Ziziphus jujuba]|uniref:Trihelix transcription factor ENAP1 n=2 Tax=Ziziphus jujuba TaxID=326968 RepID=A0A6P4BGY8_ZIZJJ|nr:trihelix transcription factor ENAP1 [Ziziphus jujuba]KAH7511894.1 hypothetical protein FEM48_Zijuj12G0031400 [Ziziphus jujuba var. spinosa]